MSFFKPYEYKEKPDLSAETAAQYGFLPFWELFFRKFLRFVLLNFIYFIITLPLLAVIFLLINGHSSPAGDGAAVFGGLSLFFSVFSFFPEKIFILMFVLSAVLYGPATMGMTYVFRNYARGEHAWLSDFWHRSISNFRQGVVFGLLDMIAGYFLINGIMSNSAGEGTSPILPILSVAALAIWLFMRNYTYLTAVTIEQSVFSILKNAWLFVLLGLKKNLLSGAAMLAIAVLCFTLNHTFTALTVPFVFYSLVIFSSVYICYPIVKKYIVDPALEAEGKKPPEK